MGVDLKDLSEKKELLRTHDPLPQDLKDLLDDWFRIELTYTSNAIEYNSLSRYQTALVVEQGLTTAGKTLREHLEAVNHVKALEWVREQSSRKISSLKEEDILKIHSFILKRIQSDYAGRYRDVNVGIRGSDVKFPDHSDVPERMADFMAWLTQEQELHPVDLAAQVHYRFVSIHPFIDGNGRTTRLLMNLVLMMSGYPPAIIHKEDREKYFASLEKAQMHDDQSDFLKIIYEAAKGSLDIYLGAIKDPTSVSTDWQDDTPKRRRFVVEDGEIREVK